MKKLLGVAQPEEARSCASSIKKTWRAETFRSILVPRNIWFSNTRMNSIVP